MFYLFLAFCCYSPKGARSKTRKPRKSRKFFPENFKSEFSILAVGQNRKLGNKKTRNNISEIFPRFPRFWYATFWFSFLILFSFFINVFSVPLSYICDYSYTLYFISEIWFLVLIFWSIKYIHNRQYKMYLQNKKIAKLWVLSICLTKEGLVWTNI